MDDTKKTFQEILEFKKTGGNKLSVHVSDGIWMGGAQESTDHESFVAVGPADWDSEEDLAFFANQEALDKFIEELMVASKKAWPA